MRPDIISGRFVSTPATAGALEAILETLGNRKVCVVRELTKVYEEAVRGSIEEVLEKLRGKDLKGEFTIVLEGAQEKKPDDYLDVHRVVEEVKMLTGEGMTRKSAFKKLANKYHTSKRAIYQIFLDYGKD